MFLDSAVYEVQVSNINVSFFPAQHGCVDGGGVSEGGRDGGVVSRGKDVWRRGERRKGERRKGGWKKDGLTRGGWMGELRCLDKSDPDKRYHRHRRTLPVQLMPFPEFHYPSQALCLTGTNIVSGYQ